MSATESSPPPDPDPQASTVEQVGVYTESNLRRLYTLVVIGLSHWLLWGVRNRSIHRLYSSYVCEQHVEIGPGNAHFLRRLPWFSPVRSVELMDRSPDALQVSEERLGARFARRNGFSVNAHLADAQRPWPLKEASARSVMACMVLHCLDDRPEGSEAPAGFAAQRPLFRQARRVLAPGGYFTGVTVLGENDPEATTGMLGKRVRGLYNAKGIFHNTQDRAQDLREELTKVFGDDPGRVKVWVAGACAFWVVRR